MADDHDKRIADSLDYLGQHIMDREEMAKVMSDAVADGIRAAVSDPAMWTAAGEAMQQRATQAAGGWLFSGMRVALSRLAWVLVIGLAIYAIGGWTALAAAWKALVAGGQP